MGQLVLFQQANITSIHVKKANHRWESCKVVTYTHTTTNQYTRLRPSLSKEVGKSYFITIVLKLRLVCALRIQMTK